MGKADLHLHTEHSDGMASVAQILDYVQEHTDLDLIAVTDHDMFDGVREAQELAARNRYRFQILSGIEVTTIEGHLLAFGISRPVKSLQRLDRTIAEVHAQGGVAVIPHPMSWLIRSVGLHGILRIQNDPAPEVFFDGIEALNPSIAGQVTVAKTKRLNRERFHLPETGGSDSHTLNMIGTGLTFFDGTTADDFLNSLRAGTTRADGQFWTREQVRELARIAPQQSYRALVKLPAKHLRRALTKSA